MEEPEVENIAMEQEQNPHQDHNGHRCVPGENIAGPRQQEGVAGNRLGVHHGQEQGLSYAIMMTEREVHQEQMQKLQEPFTTATVCSLLLLTVAAIGLHFRPTPIFSDRWRHDSQ